MGIGSGYGGGSPRREFQSSRTSDLARGRDHTNSTGRGAERANARVRALSPALPLLRLRRSVMVVMLVFGGSRR